MICHSIVMELIGGGWGLGIDHFITLSHHQFNTKQKSIFSLASLLSSLYSLLICKTCLHLNPYAIMHLLCGHGETVSHLLPKQIVRVRFPVPALKKGHPIGCPFLLYQLSFILFIYLFGRAKKSFWEKRTWLLGLILGRRRRGGC